ncbi:MAG: hypothetical protein ABI665_27225 [Vicinamibacterales bacterium]
MPSSALFLAALIFGQSQSATTMLVSSVVMDQSTCRECGRNRALLEQLQERLCALEAEVYGAPLNIDLEEFTTLQAKRNAREAALEEYHRLQREEFYRRLPELKAQAAKQRAAYEAFMRERGLQP